MESLIAGMNDTAIRSPSAGPRSGLVRETDTIASIVWCIAFGLIAVATVASNALTIAAFSRKQVQRKRTHFFLINLSSADLMVGGVAVPLWIVIVHRYSSNPGWMPSPFFSAVYFTSDMLSGFASFFSIAVIAFERLYSVLKPVKYRLLKSHVYFLAIVTIWLSAGIVVLLKFVRFQIYAIYLNIVFLCLGVPLLATMASYFGLFLKMKHCLGKAHNRQRRRVEETEDMKLVRTLLFVTVMFFITWSPFVILNAIYIYMCSSGSCPVKISRSVIYFAKLLHYGNSCINPVIYVARISTFRRAIINLLRQIFEKSFGERLQCNNLASRVVSSIPLQHLGFHDFGEDPRLETVIARLSINSTSDLKANGYSTTKF